MKLKLTSIAALVALLATFATTPPRAEVAEHQLSSGHKKGAQKTRAMAKSQEERKAARKESCKALKEALKGVGACGPRK